MADFPRIRTVGLSGLLVQFAGTMSEPANRAAIAFRASVESQGWPEVSETTISLVSTFVCVDLSAIDLAAFTDRLKDLLQTRDWYQAPLPSGRTLWHIPTLYDGPQLEEAAEAAGVSPEQAIKELSSAQARVLTIGFAPGQPYAGELPAHWNIPRQQGLTKAVPPGALVVAIRQMIVFTHEAPTGWRHVGHTAFRNYDPGREAPIALRPGDELIFPAVSAAEFEKIKSRRDGGADRQVLG